MYYYFIISIWFVTSIQSLRIKELREQIDSTCNSSIAWSLCSPQTNEIWYQYNSYDFIWKENYTSIVNRSDLYLLTVSGVNDDERTIKSWLNLTGNFFTLQVTDAWFPKSLPNGSSNLTWAIYAFILPHNHTFSSDIINLVSLDEFINFEPYTKFYAIQSPPIPIIITQDTFQHKWILAIIVVACIIVIIAICVIVWSWKNMQKIKAKNTNPYQQDNPSHKKMQSSILSTPDALMIANTFRQVMSTSDLDKSRNQVGKDLLTRQLASEGTCVLQVERRTSSTEN